MNTKACIELDNRPDVSPPVNSMRAIRKYMGLTLLQAANLIGVEFQSLSQYERGAYNPGVTRLLRMSKAYKVPLEKLLDPEFNPEDFFSK